MHVIIWVILAAVFAVAASWMMLAGILTGHVLLRMQQIEISTPWFYLVRRYGVPRAMLRSAQNAARKAARGKRPLSKKDSQAVVGLLAAPFSASWLRPSFLEWSHFYSCRILSPQVNWGKR